MQWELALFTGPLEFVWPLKASVIVWLLRHPLQQIRAQAGNKKSHTGAFKDPVAAACQHCI